MKSNELRIGFQNGDGDPRCYVHFGCFLDGKLHGVMQLGPSINKHASIN